MTAPMTDADLWHYLNLPPVELESMIDTLSLTARQELGQRMQAIAAAAAFIGCYAEARAGFGLSETPHRYATKHANIRRKRVRRVFGYQHTTDVPI